MKLTAFIGKHAIELSVDAEETKLKGYSKFRFFCFKIEKHWTICEWTTGRQVSAINSTTLVEAKKSARKYLGSDMLKLRMAIEQHKVVNE